MYVFVYGTLRKGDSRFGVLSDAKCIANPAYAVGFEMLSLGGFPGIVSRSVAGEGRIIGEVYEIDEDTLDRLDSIEGYREDDPKHSLYLRQKIDAYYEDGGTIPGPSGEGGEILTYVFNIDRAQDRGYRVIESGNWFDESPPRASREA